MSSPIGSEMLSDRDPNGGDGHASRGSSTPGLSQESGKTTPPASSPNFPALFGRGITSMLRTETEMGDVGDIVLGNYSGSSARRQLRAQWHATSSISAASSTSNASSRPTRPLPEYASSSSESRYPAVANSPQYGTNDNPSAMPNISSSPSTETIGNRDRGFNRLRPMTHTTQYSYNPSSNRSLTNLRHAHNLRLQNSYVHLSSHRAESESSSPNNWSTSSDLCDGMGPHSGTSHSIEGQRPSTGGYSHPYAMHGHPHNTMGQSSVGREKVYRGLGHPHNVGQMRCRLPHQPSTQNLENWRYEQDRFPPFGDTAYNERLGGLHIGTLQSSHEQFGNTPRDHRSEDFALPENRKQFDTADQADSKMFVVSTASSSSTYLHAGSDALFDMTAPPIAKFGRSLEVLRGLGDVEGFKLKEISTDQSNLGSPIAYATPIAIRNEPTDKMTNKVTSNPRTGADSGRGKAHGVSIVPAVIPGNGSDASISASWGDSTLPETIGNVLEYAVTSIKSGVNSLPLVVQATSANAQKLWDEQSLEPCTDVSDRSLGAVRHTSVEDGKEYPGSDPKLLPQQEECLVNLGAYSGLSAAKGATSSGNASLQLSSQSHLSKPDTVALGNSRANFGVHSPRSAVTRKPLPVYSTQDPFLCLSEDPHASHTGTSLGNIPRSSQANTRPGRGGRVAPVVGVGPRYAPRHSAAGVGSHRNSLFPTRLTDIQEDSVQENSMAELELSGCRYPGPSHHLSDPSVKSNKGSDSQSTFGTPSNVQASGEDLERVSRSSTMSHRGSDTDGNANNAFTQSHRLPPIQYSQDDLSDELTGDVRLHHVLRISQSSTVESPPKPAAAGEVHIKTISLAEAEGVKRATLSTQPIATIGLSEMYRACSPELVAKIEGLAVPLVDGVAQSFSGSPPRSEESLKRGEFAEAPIQEGTARPTQERSSACLGNVSGIPHVVSEDDVYDELEKTMKRKDNKKENSISGCMDGGVAAIGASGANAVEELKKGSGTTPTHTYHSTAALANPQAASSAVSLRRSHTLHIQDSHNLSDFILPSSTSFHRHHNAAPLPISQLAPPTASRRRSSALHAQDPRYPSGFTLSSTSSLRSLASTSEAGETHPRSPDANRPSVASINTPVDSLPHSAAADRPIQVISSHHRIRLSQASSTTAFSTTQTATGSLSRMQAGITTQAPADHLNSFGRVSNQPHEAGERYPTSALASPTAIFRDQLCISDSSGDSIHFISREAKDPLCKRILTACDNTYYKLFLRARRAQPSPEWFGPSETQVVQDRAREAKERAASKSHQQRHHEKWWKKLIRQLTARKPSSNSNV